jgi:hypothetical protein
MDIDNLTVKEAMELAATFGLKLGDVKIKDIKKYLGSFGVTDALERHPYKVGENYMIRTVTMIDIGKLVDVYKNELLLQKVSWVAETDRWYDFLKSGKTKEVEPFPDGEVIIGRGALIDACLWETELPRTQK